MIQSKVCTIDAMKWAMKWSLNDQGNDQGKWAMKIAQKSTKYLNWFFWVPIKSEHSKVKNIFKCQEMF